MGWSDCGTDSSGRPIGYLHEGKCDYGCGNAIDRGLSYACGEMHGQLEYGCEGYFCPEHLIMTMVGVDEYKFLCPGCHDEMEKIHIVNSFISTVMKKYSSEDDAVRESCMKTVFSTFRECPGEASDILDAVIMNLEGMATELVVTFGMAANAHIGKDSPKTRSFCDTVLEYFDETGMDKEAVLSVFKNGNDE